MSAGPIAPNRWVRRVPWGLVGMLVLVAVAEVLIAARRLDFTTIWADDWRCSAEAAGRRVQGRDVLCFGDSLVKFAVLPRQIEARTGLRSFNLALNAGTVPSSYFLLRRALEAGAKPKAVVVDFCSLLQPEVPDKSIRLYPDLATVDDCLGLARTAGHADFFTTAMLGKLMPSSKCRFEIRESIKAALAGYRASPWPQQAVFWETWKAQDGAQPMPTPTAAKVSNPRLVSDLAPVMWKCDPVNAAYVERFLALADREAIPVFWVMLPLSPEVQARRALNGSDDAYDAFARATLERHPGVTVLDARHSGYDDSVFVDAIHLDHRGARILTDDLSPRLVEGLEPGATPSRRWVALPPLAGRSEGVASDDWRARARR